jgi:site-specific DNA-methyltransferase (adenine-specific)
LTGSGVRYGESGKPWRHVDPTAVKRHWAIPGHVIERYGIIGGSVQERLDALDEAGLIFWPKDGAGTPRLKWYADELEGMTISDIWTDIPPLSAASAERLGYPTQKPLALLERIVAASSSEGDVILDPFCGCGTAVHAAQKLNRKWIGIDITHLAICLIEKRLKDAFPGTTFDVHGTPRDPEGARDLAHRDKYQFQWWACSLVGAQPCQGKKKGADGGIDGIIYFQDEPKTHKKVIVSVKGGEHVTVAMIRDLAHVVSREGAEMGFFITLISPTKPMMTEAVKEGFYTSPHTGNAFPKIQILTIEDLLSGKERPLYPDLSQGATTFKKAKIEEKQSEQKKLF